jgi:hypothetical protein
MDNGTHTLVGLALAESGLNGRSRYSRTEIRSIGADLPGVSSARGTKAGAEFLVWARYPGSGSSAGVTAFG